MLHFFLHPVIAFPQFLDQPLSPIQSFPYPAPGGVLRLWPCQLFEIGLVQEFIPRG